MPRAARDYEYRGNYGYGNTNPQPNYQSLSQAQPKAYPRPYPIGTPQHNPYSRPNLQPVRRKKIQRKKKRINQRKVHPFAKMIWLAMLALIAIYPLPYGYAKISKPLIFGPSYKEVKVNYGNLYSPTVNYLSNDLFLNTRLLTPAKTNKPEMTTLYTTEKMGVLEARLTRLMSEYKTIDPSIFVWDYETGKYVDIKASVPYSAASIIKIPVLIQLFKSMEANQLTIYDEMTLTPYYKAEGSGDLQRAPLDSKYTIDDLARVMIEKSDNSATNMLISAVGSMTDVNSGIRSWGLKNTYLSNWLPDIAGTNYTTTKDLATMLYNLDNPGFLNINSREYMIDYMSHVENNRLIQAGLDKKALFIHKTGDIGKMLGDAGIVYVPNGKKYIVAILANRPYNSPLGKDFIQKASAIIYSSMTSGAY